VLVQADHTGSASLEFLPLAVMGWEEVLVDAEGVMDRHELGARFVEALRTALGGDLPLGVRVHVTGRTPAHGGLAAEPERLVNELRALAEDASGGRAWVEKVVLRTASPVDLEALRASDTPQGDLLRSLDALVADPQALAGLGLDLTDIEAKLRAVPGSGVDLPDLREPVALAALLEDVRELVLPLLLDAAEGDGR